MRKLKLDVSKSKEVYDTCKDRIEPKSCYNNCFAVLDYDSKPFRDGTWKICYGYVEVMSGLYCRHCFIIGEDGKVIDPTTFTHKEPPTHRTYYVMYVFDDVDGYLSAVFAEDCMPSLDLYFKDKDSAAQEWAKEHSLIFVG